jgi:hypothetical protein
MKPIGALQYACHDASPNQGAGYAWEKRGETPAVSKEQLDKIKAKF